MTKLIKITQSAEGVNVVSGQELHEFLEVGVKFSDWIARKIKKYQLIENQDYLLVAQKRATNNPKNPTYTFNDYALTLDCAKQLAMVENNDRGKQARIYFIEAEKELRAIKQIPTEEIIQAPKTTREWIKVLLRQEDEKDVLQARLDIAQPKADFVDQLMATDDTIVTTVIAAEMGLTAIAFNRLLKENSIQHKVNGVWVLTQEYNDRGYTQMKTYLYTIGEKVHSTLHMVWTQKGRAMLLRKFKQPLPTSQLMDSAGHYTSWYS